MSERMRELWLAETRAQPWFDEFLAHTEPDGYDQARYKGSGSSSHSRLHLTKIKQEKPNKCRLWLESSSKSLAGLTSAFPLHLNQVYV